MNIKNIPNKILILFLIAIIISGVYLFVNNPFEKNGTNEEFMPDKKIISTSKDEEGNRIYTFNDEQGNIYEVNENMYINDNGIHTIYSDDYLNDDGTRTIKLSSAQINFYEDGGLKKIENVKSLKNSGIGFGYQEYDPRYNIEIVDYNFTSIIIKPIINDEKELNKNIPYKINGKIIGDVKYSQLSQKEEIIIYGDILNSNFTIGEHSTTIRVNGTGYLGRMNARDDQNFADIGTEGFAGIRTDYWWRSAMNFTTSVIPSGMEIISFNISMYITEFGDLANNYSFVKY